MKMFTVLLLLIMGNVCGESVVYVVHSLRVASHLWCVLRYTCRLYALKYVYTHEDNFLHAAIVNLIGVKKVTACAYLYMRMY